MSKWILITFSANVETITMKFLIVTTKEKWEHTKDVLRSSRPNNEPFKAVICISGQITHEYTVDSYLSSFSECEITVECARALASQFGWHSRRRKYYEIRNGIRPLIPCYIVDKWLDTCGFIPSTTGDDADPDYIELMDGT